MKAKWLHNMYKILDKTTYYLRRIAIQALVILLLLLEFPNLVLGDVTVSGKTYIISNSMAAEPQYKPLANVKIFALRDQGMILPKPEESDSNGDFKLSIPSGGPFNIIFHSKGNIPELKQLAGISNYSYKVAVVLEKVDDYINNYNYKKASLRSLETKSFETMLDLSKQQDNETKTLHNDIQIILINTKSYEISNTQKDLTIDLTIKDLTIIDKNNYHKSTNQLETTSTNQTKAIEEDITIENIEKKSDRLAQLEVLKKQIELEIQSLKQINTPVPSTIRLWQPSITNPPPNIRFQ